MCIRDRYCIVINSTRASVYCDIGNAAGPYIDPTIPTLSLNTWYNLVFTQSRSAGTSSLALYINGVKYPGTVYSASGSVNVNTSALTIGLARLTGNYFPGRIAHFVLYNRTLGDLEVMRNFDALRGRFGI